MLVEVVAQTQVTAFPADYNPHPWGDFVKSADELGEMAGRLCYRSYDRPNPKTATNGDYLANIIKQRHFSVLEHASVTFYITGVSRALLAELTRHRHFSYSVVSQRYVDAQHFDSVIPPVFDGPLGLQLQDHYEECLVRYNAAVADLLAKGHSRKEARGAARAFLPEATSVELFLTGNHTAFRQFLEKRLSPAADLEIRELALTLLVKLQKIAPNTYQDFTE